MELSRVIGSAEPPPDDVEPRNLIYAIDLYLQALTIKPYAMDARSFLLKLAMRRWEQKRPNFLRRRMDRMMFKIQLRRIEDPQKRLLLSDKHLSIYPHDGLAYLELGKAARENGYIEVAQCAFQEAIRRNVRGAQDLLDKV